MCRIQWVVLLLCPLASALYFSVQQGDERCFIEDLPEQTAVVAKYRLDAYDEETKAYRNEPDMGVHITVTDPQGVATLDTVYKVSPGSFAFTSLAAGEHRICFSTAAVWFNGLSLRIHLDLAVAESGADYDEIKRRDKLDDLELRVKQLLGQCDQIQKEQAYQRVREARFRDTTESTHWRVVYWSLIQLGILIASAVWQMRHLRRFFQTKKLV